jgi:3-oxoacyl-[acyl-carrier protein] reductase
LDERVILITGAAAGIGLAAAERLARDGFRIAAVDIDERGLQNVVKRCRSIGTVAEPFVCDITDEAAVMEMYSRVKDHYGAVDILVHSAGVGRYAPFLDLELDEWRSMLEVNLLGIVSLVRVSLEDMLQRGSGRIILVGSRRGLEPAPGTSAYSASKAALIGFARGLALEVAARGIQICLLAPGGVKTDFGGVPHSEKDPRYLDPDTVAESIAYVAGTPPEAWVRELTLLPLGL